MHEVSLPSELIIRSDLISNRAHLISQFCLILKAIFTIAELGVLQQRVGNALRVELNLFHGYMDSLSEVVPVCSAIVQSAVGSLVFCEFTGRVESLGQRSGFRSRSAETAPLGNLFLTDIIRVAALQRNLRAIRLEATRSNQFSIDEILFTLSLDILVELADLLLELWFSLGACHTIAYSYRGLPDIRYTTKGKSMLSI